MPAGPEGVELEDAEMQGIMPRAISQVRPSCTWCAGSTGHSALSLELQPGSEETTAALVSGNAQNSFPSAACRSISGSSALTMPARHCVPPSDGAASFSSQHPWCLQVFRELKRNAPQFNVGVSYVEIYNEGFRDLLQPETKMSTISISESKK